MCAFSFVQVLGTLTYRCTYMPLDRRSKQRKVHNFIFHQHCIPFRVDRAELIFVK